MKVAEKFDIDVSEALVIEDSLAGVQAGKNANMTVVNIYDQYAEGDRGSITALADFSVNDFSELINIFSITPKYESTFNSIEINE